MIDTSRLNYFLDVFFSIQCGARATECYRTLYGFNIHFRFTCKKDRKEDPWLFILITAVFVNLSYYRSDREAEALQHLSGAERGIEMVPLEFDGHTR